MNSLELFFGDIFERDFLDGIFGFLVLFVGFIDYGVGTLANGFIEKVWANFS